MSLILKSGITSIVAMVVLILIRGGLVFIPEHMATSLILGLQVIALLVSLGIEMAVVTNIARSSRHGFSFLSWVRSYLLS